MHYNSVHRTVTTNFLQQRQQTTIYDTGDTSTRSRMKSRTRLPWRYDTRQISVQIISAPKAKLRLLYHIFFYYWVR